MLYDLRNSVDSVYFREKARELADAQKDVVELSKKTMRRTIKQNAYLHVCLALFASEFGQTLEEVKVDVFKRTVNNALFTGRRKNRRGEDVAYLKSSSELTTAELTTAIERFRNFSAQIAGLYIPAPEERDALLEAQKQINVYQNYL